MENLKTICYIDQIQNEVEKELSKSCESMVSY